MARRSQTVDVQDATLSHETAGTPADFFSSLAPLVAAWCESGARMVALMQEAAVTRAAALSTLAKSMCDVAALAGSARSHQDLATVGAHLQQAWMDLGRTRQEDLTRIWSEAQGEVARQFQSLADRNVMSMTAGQVEAGPAVSPMATLMDQARASMDQWTRDWMAIAKAPEAVQ